jgi:uncharacterized membrane protein YhaH (DUF805 family)
MMTFRTAVRTCLRHKYATFSGRASRAEFWWFVLFSWVLMFVVMAVLGSLLYYLTVSTTGASGVSFTPIFSVLVGIAYLSLSVPMIAVTVRRLHDLGLSGWWYGSLFAMLGLAWVFPQSLWVALIFYISALVCMLACVFKGTSGPNKYGPDPLMSTNTEIFE